METLVKEFTGICDYLVSLRIGIALRASVSADAAPAETSRDPADNVAGANFSVAGGVSSQALHPYSLAAGYHATTEGLARGEERVTVDKEVIPFPISEAVTPGLYRRLEELKEWYARYVCHVERCR